MEITLGICILGTFCFLSMILKEFRLYTAHQVMKDFIKTGKKEKLKKIPFLKNMLDDYEQHIMLNGMNINTKVLIRKHYYEDRILKLPVWMLDSFVHYGIIVLILVGLGGSILELMEMDVQGNNHIMSILWPTFLSLAVSIGMFVIQMFIGGDVKKEKIFIGWQEYLDNHYGVLMEMKKQKELEEVLSWEEVEKGMERIQGLLTEVEKKLQPIKKKQPVSSTVDEETIQQMISQIII